MNIAYDRAFQSVKAFSIQKDAFATLMMERRDVDAYV
jgi:hypothetical protein